MDIFKDISAIGLASIAVILTFNLISMHLKNNTEALHQLKEVIKELTYYIKNGKK